MSSGHSSLWSSNTVSMASCNDVRFISWGFLHKTLDKRDVNFDSKVEQETRLFMVFLEVSRFFFSTKTPMLAMIDPKKHLENPKERCLPGASWTFPTCPPRQRVAQPRKQPTVTSPENVVAACFLGLDSWHHQVTFVVGVAGTGMYLPEVELKGNSFLT